MMKKKLKRIDTNARLIALLGCIKQKVAMLLRVFSFKWKNTEEVKHPLDYEKKHWHKYDWEKLNSKDEWN